MKILVNGEVKEFFPQALSVLDILRTCKVEAPEMVSVQVNGSFVNKSDYDTVLLRDSDEIDFLYFMGGGNR